MDNPTAGNSSHEGGQEMEDDVTYEDMAESSSDDENDADQDDEMENDAEAPRVFLPGDRLDPGEELLMDDQVYVVFHQANLGAPCLSFDMIPESDSNLDYPLQIYGVAGTQSSKTTNNNIILFKMTNLHPVRRHDARKSGDEDDDDESSDEEELTEHSERAPKMKVAALKHVGCINRIRYKALGSAMVAAAWSETGSVGIWSLDETFRKVEECRNFSITSPGAIGSKEVPRDMNAKPIFAFNGHLTEGFAIDWSPTQTGVLASGDCQRFIFLWKPVEGGSWVVDHRHLIGHTDSVEDLQWSPNEPNVLASCSVDKSIRIYDCRARGEKACMLTVANSHDSDVNVINWNPNEPFIASGGDEGHLKIWDLRTIGKGLPVAIFKHHRGPITSVEWHKSDSTVVASSGEDNQVVIWDLALETDDEDPRTLEEDPKLHDLPPQLLFIHQGLQEIKEVHWHPRFPGLILATSNSGFDIFKTIST